jgi:protease I
MQRIALLIDEAFEDSEFAYPYSRLQEAGCRVDIIGNEKRIYTGKKGTKAHADLALADASADDYDALYIPGGHAPEKLCKIPEMAAFVRTLHEEKKPICAVCHGPLLLAEADLLDGRTVTGYKSTKTALTKAGARYTGESVEGDDNIITARDPGSLPEMTQRFIELLKKQC